MPTVTLVPSDYPSLSDGSDATSLIPTVAPFAMTNFGLPAGARTVNALLKLRAKSDSGTYTPLTLRWGPNATGGQVSLNWQGGGVIRNYTTQRAVALNWTTPQIFSIAASVLWSISSLRVYELSIELLYALQPACSMDGPIGTITDRSAVTLAWTHTPGTDGTVQGRYQMRVFTPAQYSVIGFNPGTAPAAAWESGEVPSGAASVVTDPLPNGTYRAYGRTAQTINGQPHWSPWDYVEFTINVDTPDVAGITATVDPVIGAARLAVEQQRVAVIDLPLSVPDGYGVSCVSTPNVAALQLTGSFTITMWVWAEDWTQGIYDPLLLNKETAFTGYNLSLNAAGTLRVIVGVGGAIRAMTSTAHGLVDGQGYWIEAFYNDTAKTCRFRKSADPLITPIGSITWTTISTTAAHAGGSPAINGLGLTLGRQAPSTSDPGFVGLIGRMRLANAAGTVVADLDTIADADIGATAFTDSTGKVWTLAGDAELIAGDERSGTGLILWDTLEVQASYDGGTTWRNVYGGGPGIPVGDSWTGIDVELPIDIEAVYRARGVAVVDGQQIVGAWVESNTVRWTTPSAWLKHLYDTTLTRPVCFRDFPTEQRARSMSVRRVLGRRAPVVRTGQLATRQGEFSVFAAGALEREDLERLMDDSGPWLIQVPAELGGAINMYVGLGDLEVQRVSGGERSRLQSRYVPSGYVEIDRPLLNVAPV